MTKLAKIMLTALTFGAFGIYLTSCSQSEIVENTTENTIEQTVQAPTNENGWLHFADDASMDAAFVELIESFSEVKAWEAKYNHNSLRARYEAALEEIDAAEAMGIGFEQLIEQYKDVLQVVGEGDERQIVCIVDDIVTPALLNEDGILQVGQYISKYSTDKIKIITDGDASKIAMLDDIDETNEAMGIEVIDFNEEEEIESRGIRCFSEFTNIERFVTVNNSPNRRVRFRISLYRSNQSYRLYMLHEMRGQRRTGVWLNSGFDYQYRIATDYHIVDQGTALPTPPIVADGDFEIGWKNGSGRETENDFLYQMSFLGDLDVYLNDRLQASDAIAGTVDVPNWNSFEKWVFECVSVWYPWND